MNTQFVLIGDLMIDITAVTNGPVNYASDTRAQISVHLGGANANTATWLAYLGENVHLHATEISGAPTGTCIVILDSTGERTMLPDPGANSFLAPYQITDSLFRAGAHLHMSGYTLLNPATREVGQIRWIFEKLSAKSTCFWLTPMKPPPLPALPTPLRP